MTQTPIVAIGASAGGLDVIKTIVKALPDGFAGAVFIVQHIARYAKNYLPEILGGVTRLTVMHACEGDAIRPSHIYCMVPDHHLLVGKDVLYVRHGPAENRFRPSIDAMFRSAAYNHGPAVIGVVVSGDLSDGTSGLWTIKLFGGTSIVQDPEEALFPSMPRSALSEVDIDHCAKSREIGPLIVRLMTTMRPTTTATVDKSVRARLRREFDIAAGDNDFRKEKQMLGNPSPFACPDCHGILSEIDEGAIRRYRCHVGHAYSTEALLDGLTEDVELKIAEAKRGLQETAMLLERMGKHMLEQHDQEAAKQLLEKAAAMKSRADALGTTLAQDRNVRGTDGIIGD